ncbi:MAG: HNH endonuclease [Armatimonadetes bacterium]|nr:HNH endonuclease [Armatimonadota bacterium]
MEGPNGAHYVSESKVEEARCCGEILDLRENMGGEVQAGGPTWDRPDVSVSGPRLKQAIPPSIRRLVFERDHGRCQAPGCRNRAFNHIHHIIPRSCPGSSHSPENLCLICAACHRALHDGRLSVEGKAPGKLIWRNKKGRVIGGGGGSETESRSRVASQGDFWGPLLLPQTS